MSSSSRCAKLYFKVLTLSLVFTLTIWVFALFAIRSSIDWTSRSISATCFDPNSNSSEWGSSDYKAEWVVCEMHGINGTCTPWGFDCMDYDTSADRCPSDFGGEGDGCMEPSSILSALIDMIFHLGSTPKNPMIVGQSTFFIMSIILILPLSLCITYWKWERNQHRKYTVPTELLPGVVTAIEIDDNDDYEEEIEQPSIYRPMV